MGAEEGVAVCFFQHGGGQVRGGLEEGGGTVGGEVEGGVVVFLGAWVG